MESPAATAQIERDFRATVAQVGEFADDLQAGLLVEDTSRRILGCNDRFCELLGIDVNALTPGEVRAHIKRYELDHPPPDE